MILHAQVKANSKTDSIYIDATGTLHIRISAERVEGRANKYLLKYLAEIFDVPPSKITIIKGQHTTRKTISMEAAEEHIKTFLGRIERK